MIRQKKTSARGEVTATVTQWAQSIGMDRHTLESRMIKADVPIPAVGMHISAKEIIKALWGDEQAEKVRGMKLDNDAKEKEARIADGELVDINEVEALLTQRVLSVLRPRILALPTTVDVACNKEHPDLARQVLSEWVDDTLRMLPDSIKENESKD